MPVAKPAAPRIACRGCFQEIDVAGLAAGGGVVCRRCGAFDRIRSGEVIERPVSAEYVRAAAAAAAERTRRWGRTATGAAIACAVYALVECAVRGGVFGLIIGAPASLAGASLFLLVARRYRDIWTVAAAGLVGFGLALAPLVALGRPRLAIVLLGAGLAAGAVPVVRRYTYPVR